MEIDLYTYAQVKNAENSILSDYKHIVNSVRRVGFSSNILKCCESNSKIYFPSVIKGEEAWCYENFFLGDVNFLFVYDAGISSVYVVIQNVVFASALFFIKENLLLYGSKSEDYYISLLKRNEDVLRKGVSSGEQCYDVNRDFGIINGYSRPYHYFYDHLPFVLDAVYENPSVNVFQLSHVAFMSNEDVHYLSGASRRFNDINSALIEDYIMLLPGVDRKAPPEIKVKKLRLRLEKAVEGKRPRGDGSNFFSLWIGLCSEKRHVVNLIDAIELVINSALEKNKSLVIFCDGLTCPADLDAYEFRVLHCEKELALFEEIKKIFPDVFFIDLIGSKAIDKISYSKNVDFYFSNALTDSIWTSTFYDIPGVAYCSPRSVVSVFCHKNTEIIDDKGVKAISTGSNFAYDNLVLDLPEVKYRVDKIFSGGEVV